MSNLRDQLQAIYNESKTLTPALVVEEARPKSSPLHSRFEWDNRVAGEAYRRHQAHELIQSVTVVYREATETTPEARVRVFHAVRTEDGHVYKPNDDVIDDPFTSQIVLRDMEREWKQLHRRYERFSEFLAMVREDLEQRAV